MKLELTVKVTYLPDWSTWEGTRELVQNARDEEVRTGTPMVVRHTGKHLRLFNPGSRLQHRDLLFGQTDKADRSDLAGQFGEGLKLGALALIRAGHEMKIRTGTEIWTPAIEHSIQYDEPVLVFNIRKGGKDIGGTQVDVTGIDALDWARMREKFLFLSSLGEDEAVGVPGSGRIITSERFRHKLYVKGIFVQTNEDLKFGYDFDRIDVDRDRRLISPFNLKWETAVMWRRVVSGASGKQFVDPFYDVLAANSADISSLHDHMAEKIPEEIVELLKDRFAEEHGELAVPVTTLAESRDLGYAGFKGVIVGQALMNALLSRSGGLKGVKERAAERVVARYSWHDLSEKERAVFDRAIECFALSGDEIDQEKLEVVRFRDERQKGMYQGGMISMSRCRLEDVSLALCTLVHEAAHVHGPDGSHEHMAAIERIWSDIHREMLKRGAS